MTHLFLFFLLLNRLVSLEGVFVHHVLQRSQALGLRPGAGRFDFTEPQNLESARNDAFSLVASQQSAEFAFVNDSLEQKVSARSASNVSGFGSPGPHVLAVGSMAAGKFKI